MQTANRDRSKPTELQRRIFDYIVDFTRRNHYQPSLEEMAREFGKASKNSMVCHMSALERKGWIERNDNQARAIKILRWPAGE